MAPAAVSHAAGSHPGVTRAGFARAVVARAGVARAAVVVFGVASLVLAACGGSSPTATPGTSTGGPGGTTGTATVGTTAGGTSSTTSPCAWPTKADKATLNVAYPDTAATYWGTSYLLAPGENLELQGRYPDARYASFITYGPGGGAIGVLTDRDIAPDPGGTNPFVGSGGPPGGSYTVTIRSDGSKAPNAVAASGPSLSGAAPGTTAASTGGTLPEVERRALLGSGTPGAPGAVGGTVLYRVYLSKTAGDPTGGAGLPAIRVIHADGSATPVPPCPSPGANPAATAIVDANGPATDTPAPAQPVFLRPKAGSANLYPNPDNVYVVTILHHTPGKVVVVRGKAPSFPNTAEGARISGREQVRYWSLCTDEYRKPYPVSFCIADQDVTIAADGTYTFVVSTAQDRPPNATAANGVTWLDWGATDVDNLLLLRHMLAAPDFTESAINLAPGALASTTMGPYAPVGVYCDAATFAREGPSGCPA